MYNEDDTDLYDPGPRLAKRHSGVLESIQWMDADPQAPVLSTSACIDVDTLPSLDYPSWASGFHDNAISTTGTYTYGLQVSPRSLSSQHFPGAAVDGFLANDGAMWPTPAAYFNISAGLSAPPPPPPSRPQPPPPPPPPPPPAPVTPPRHLDNATQSPASQLSYA